MLGYSRIVGQLSKVFRQAHAKNYRDFYIGCARYSSKIKKSKTGTTVKVEECVPKTKTFKKVPPLPPTPPPPHAQTVPTPHIERARPLCEDRTYSCPPNCPPVFQEDCYKPRDPGGGNRDTGFKYWKHVIAALILAGVSAYAYVEYSKKEVDKKKKMGLASYKRPKIIPNPQQSKDFPAEIDYLLVGGGTTSFSAFRSIKSSDPTAKVIVITEEGDLPYMRPPLSKELWYMKEEKENPKLIFRQWNGSKRSLFYEPPDFYVPVYSIEKSDKGGVAVATGWKVSKIDPVEQIAYLSDGAKIKYNKCLIATGSSPKNLSIFETAPQKIKDKVIVFRTKEDYLELANNIKNPDVQDIVIIGGGFLGSELSTSIAQNRKNKDQKVTQIYKEKYLLSQVLPEYLCEWTTKHAEAEGVQCKPNLEVHDCALKNDKVALTLTNGEIIEADQIIVAIGVEANTQLAQESKLEVDPEQGGILVNAELQARKNLWVAGDVACFYDVQLGRRRVEHHDHAVISGRLAGENMTGAGKPYVHQSMFWSDLGPEVGFEAIGIIDSNMETVGVFAKLSKEEKEELAAEKAESDESDTSTSESSAVQASEKAVHDEPEDDYTKGVIFYLRDNVVVGIVLWNIFNRMTVARQLLKRGTKYEELNEVAKLFAIHED